MQPLDSRRAFVIVNQTAARARRVWPDIRRVLAERSVRFDAHETRAQGDAETAARRALLEGYGTIAVVGGDGTLSEAARGFFETDGVGGSVPENEASETPRAVEPLASLAVLPAGTGDDFARGIAGGRRAPLDEWLERLIAHCGERNGERRDGAATTRLVDAIYASVNDRAKRFVCLNAASIGASAEVVRRVAAQRGPWRRLSGEARFAIGALGAVASWRNREVRLSVDDEYVMECSTNLVVVVNGAYAGGGMQFAPGALNDDGQLDVLTACRISRAGVMRELARIHRGGHLANPQMIVRRGARISVETADPSDPLQVEADGDVRGQTPAGFRVMHAALRVVC